MGLQMLQGAFTEEGNGGVNYRYHYMTYNYRFDSRASWTTVEPLLSGHQWDLLYNEVTLSHRL